MCLFFHHHNYKTLYLKFSMRPLFYNYTKYSTMVFMDITITKNFYNIGFAGRKPNKYNPEEVIDLYRKGIKLTDITKQTGCSYVHIKEIISALPNEKEIRQEHAYNSKYIFATTPKENDIIKMFREGIPATEIAKKYNCDAQVIRNIINKQQNARELQIINKHELRFNADIQYQMLNLYKNGYPIGFIANKYECSKAAVQKILSQFGGMKYLRRFYQYNQPAAIEKLKDEIFNFYKQTNENILRVADKFGYSGQTILKLVAKMSK